MGLSNTLEVVAVESRRAMSCSLWGAVLKYRRQQKPPKDCPRMLHCVSGLMRTLRMISESLMMLSALHHGTMA